MPFSVPKSITIDLFQQAPIEGREVMIDLLCRAPSQKNGQPYLSSLKLAFVK